MPRCVMRRNASVSGFPSGMKISAVELCSFIKSLLESWQASRGHCLANASSLFIRHMDRNLLCDLGKLPRQHFPRLRNHNVSTLASSDAAQNEHVAERVKICVVWNRVTEIH